MRQFHLLLLIAAAWSLQAQAAAPPSEVETIPVETADERDVAAPSRLRIGPRIGLSPSTGLFGIEGQMDHFGMGVGVMPFCFFGECFTITTLGAKYYVQPSGDSWAAGGFVWRANKGDYDNVDPDWVFGASVEYRWRFGSGWDVAAGMALGVGSGYDEPRDPGDDDVGVFPTVAAGYSF